MKKCPRCGQVYSDADINFCLNDGELLSRSVDGAEAGAASSDDPPPTIFMDQPRQTTQLDWQTGQPPAPYQRPMAYPAGQAGPVVPLRRSQDMTLAIVSLSFGLASITIGWCCSMGLLFSPIALVTGGIALYFNRNDPEKYGGKGFAIAGVATSSIFLVLYILLMLLYGLALFLPR